MNGGATATEPLIKELVASGRNLTQTICLHRAAMRYRRPNLPDRSAEFPRSDAELTAEHQRLVAELRASDDRWRALVENAPIGIAVHQDNCLVFANPEALRIVGAKN